MPMTSSKKTSQLFLRALLRSLARLTVKRFSPMIIGVTGSVGKTSTKEAIAAALSSSRRVAKSPGNLNNELGLPLAIIGGYERIERPALLFWMKVIARAIVQLCCSSAKSFPEILVLEYAADAPGDIAYLLSIAKPHIGVISAIGSHPVHAEHYPLGAEGVLKEKAKLVLHLGAGDTAVLNADDTSIKDLTGKIRSRMMFFGESSHATIKISHITHDMKENKIQGLMFKLESEGLMLPVHLSGVFSSAHAYAVAAAVCVARACDINPITAVQAIEKWYEPVGGRSALVPGMKDTQIIDESYNSSPLALEAALKSFGLIYNTRKIAVLGDMLELGAYTIQAHKNGGVLAARYLDALITVGPRGRILGEEALEKGMSDNAVFFCEDAKQASAILLKIFKKGDIILIKGSRAMGLDEVVAAVRKEEA